MNVKAFHIFSDCKQIFYIMQEILNNKNEQIEVTKWTGHNEIGMKREDQSGAELLWGWHER